MKVRLAYIAFLLFLITAQFNAPTFSPKAFALDFSGEVYAKAEVRDAYFCLEPNTQSAVFAIPYTYCVQVLSENGDWYKVKYAEDDGVFRALYGYCLKSKLTLLSKKPAITYLNKTVAVKYSINIPSTSLPVLNEITLNAAYYGSYYQGPTAYSYVYCEGSFGYISGANDDYPLNLNETPTPSENATSTEQPNVKLIVGVCIGVLVAAALLLLFFGNRKKPFNLPFEKF
ncbi:MAG: hypothetical protein J6B04_03610 [Clostridia bacterium]|nr:hypothetical protein [Clostridia bacterium]